MPAKKKWIITLTGSRSISLVKKDIAALGFETEQVLDAIGCITGSATESAVKKIQSMKIKGIADISPESGPVDIGPPDAPVTW
jgi:hypothetical protein